MAAVSAGPSQHEDCLADDVLRVNGQSEQRKQCEGAKKVGATSLRNVAGCKRVRPKKVKSKPFVSPKKNIPGVFVISLFEESSTSM